MNMKKVHSTDMPLDHWILVARPYTDLGILDLFTAKFNTDGEYWVKLGSPGLRQHRIEYWCDLPVVEEDL